MSNIGFIGVGNMGGALARAAALSGHTILLTDKDMTKANSLARELGAKALSAEDIIASADLVFLGVKPQMLASVAAELAPALSARGDDLCIVSFLAGVSLASLAEALGRRPIIRMMPNTPASVGEGVVVYAAGDAVSADREALFCEVLAHAGLVDPLPESLIDAATAVMGCGPAYIYLMLEALADGGVACGLPRAKALLYAEQTALGAAALAKQSAQHPGALKDAVCSPGGSTIAGVEALEQGGFRGTVMAAVKAAHRRTEELGK